MSPTLGRARTAGTAAARWTFRRRFEFAPAAADLGLTALSWWHHATGVTGPEHLTYAAATLGAAALGAKGLQHKHKTAALTGVGGTVLMANTWIGAAVGPSAPSLIAAGLMGVGAYSAYVPWLTKARQDRLALQVKAAKAGVGAEGLGDSVLNPGLTGSSTEETALLRALAALLTVPAVDVTSLEYTPFGWRAIAILPPGRNTSPQKVIARRDQLAANLGLPGRLRLAKGETDNELVVSLYESDPLASTIPWPGPSTTSCTEPALLGLDAFGQPVHVPLLYNHVLIGGATDNGKSGIQNVLIAYAVACKDAEVLLVDLKPGAVELGPWRSCALGLADTPSRAMQLLKMVWAEVERRGEYLRELGEQLGKPVKKWIPGEHGPAWCVFIDELAELVRRVPTAAKLVESLLQVARFAGITLVCATQSPSNKVFGGSTDGRQQYQVRIGLGAKESTTANLIFGPGAYGDGWTLDELDAPGKFLRWDREHQVPVEARAFWMSEDEIGATTHRYALESAGEGREHPEHEPEPDDDPPPPPPPGPGGGRPILRAVPVFPDGTEVPDNRTELWQAIEKAGPRGITIPELVAIEPDGLKARGSVSDPLMQWIRKDWVIQVGTRDRSKVYAVAPRRRLNSATEKAETAIVSG
ncbi:FtsK/SpoIIIE domain-containing protein [Streptomyces sp. MBT27]|uniref:FtsK/SpoIIIE domain-containing protein n=1 Tax=Streptomyces sp. MBT27 TaxID=1488356 RepID=UPI0014212BB6|nr:FtsK/SpoIIIE domain-containing protein [Streptomyces sp. MBT27]